MHPNNDSVYVAPGVPRMLREPEVLAAFGGGRTRMYEEIHAGRWPAPVRTGKRAKAWHADEIHAAQEERRVARRIRPVDLQAKAPPSLHLKKAIAASTRARRARAAKKKRSRS